MKPKNRINELGKALALTAFFAILAVAAFSIVPASAKADDAPAATAAAEAPAAATDPVEVRIKELHDKLKITDAQGDLWSAVTKEMRDHAKTAQDSIATREKGASTMTALDDLKSYADIAQLHADGMKHFIDVFTPLYNAMSDAQKKNADKVFVEHKAAHAKKHKTALKKG